MKQSWYIFLIYLVVVCSTSQISAIPVDFTFIETPLPTYVLGDVDDCKNYDIIFHHCFWDVTNFEDGIKGNITTYFKPLLEGFNCIAFDMHDSLAVDSILYHGMNLSFDHTQDKLVISFSASIPVGHLDSIQVVYHGKTNQAAEQYFANPYAENNLNGQSNARSFSEPYYAKYWWPCKEGLTDKIDSLEVSVKTLKGLYAISNGVLKSTSVDSSYITFNWKHHYPIATYLIAFAVGDYTNFKNTLYDPQTKSNFDFNTYLFKNKDTTFYKNEVLGAALYFQKLIDTLEFYPFVKDGYAQTVVKGFNGGMENQTSTFLGEDWSRELLIHEFAHQWFGDYITCGSWSDIWLNEGFATYFQFADIPWNEDNLYNTFRYLITQLYVKDNTAGYVYHRDTINVKELFNDATYAKGAFVLDMLEYKLGWPTFIKGLKSYLHDPTLKYAEAKTTLFRQHLETAGNVSLKKFFDYWVYGNAMPEYDIEWNQLETLLTVKIRQVGANNPAVPFIAMPVEFLLKNNTTNRIVQFDNDQQDQTFHATLDFKTDSLIFNPHNRIMCHQYKINFNSKLKSSLQVATHGSLMVKNLPDYLQIIDTIPSATSLIATLSDITGKVIFQKEFYNELRFPTLELASGIYLIYVSSENHRLVEKFLVQH